LYVSGKDIYRYAHSHNTLECISDMHSAYDIWTLLYVHVSACIPISDALYPASVHICLYVGYIQPTYKQIHTDMDSKGEFISACICLYFCSEYMHICTPVSSAYLQVSACIWILNTCRYAFLTLDACAYPLTQSVHICMHLSAFCSLIHGHMPVHS
jgi:hypothetical protein